VDHMITLVYLKIQPASKPLTLVYSGILVYDGHFKKKSAACHLSVYDGSDLRVLVATEIPENEGLSITNGIEYVAVAAEELLKLSHVFGKRGADKPSVLIEHYTPESYEGRGRGEDFSVIGFGAEKCRMRYYGEPEWTPIGRSEVERLIGRGLA